MEIQVRLPITLSEVKEDPITVEYPYLVEQVIGDIRSSIKSLKSSLIDPRNTFIEPPIRTTVGCVVKIDPKVEGRVTKHLKDALREIVLEIDTCAKLLVDLSEVGDDGKLRNVTGHLKQLSNINREIKMAEKIPILIRVTEVDDLERSKV